MNLFDEFLETIAVTMNSTALLAQGQNWHSPNVTTSLALKMAACRLLNFMNTYDVDFTAHRIAFVYMVDQSQIAGTEAPASRAVTALWSLHLTCSALALVYE